MYDVCGTVCVFSFLGLYCLYFVGVFLFVSTLIQLFKALISVEYVFFYNNAIIIYLLRIYSIIDTALSVL